MRGAARAEFALYSRSFRPLNVAPTKWIQKIRASLCDWHELVVGALSPGVIQRRHLPLSFVSAKSRRRFRGRVLARPFVGIQGARASRKSEANAPPPRRLAPRISARSCAPTSLPCRRTTPRGRGMTHSSSCCRVGSLDRRAQARPSRSGGAGRTVAKHYDPAL